MPIRGPFNLNWPWHWLLGIQQPGEFAVPTAVAPVVDVGQHNRDLRPFSQTIVLAAGTNQFVLPGFMRVGSLNPATHPTPNTRGARRWLALGARMTSGNPPATMTFTLFFQDANTNVVLVNHESGTTFGQNDLIPLVRSAYTDNTALAVLGFPGSVYVPDPFTLTLQATNAAGAETVEISGVFLEADSLMQPLPDMF